MRINPSACFYTNEHQPQMVQDDVEQAEGMFKKILLKQMIKQMYKTTSFTGEQPSIEKDFYQDQFIENLSTRIFSNYLPKKESKG